MKKKTSHGASASASASSSTPAPSRIADARFASFETDPRFRLPSKKLVKTTLDKRFSGMLDDEDFIASAKVDRYGRKVHSDAKKKALQRLYRADNDKHDAQPADQDELVQRELLAAYQDSARKAHDPARQGGFSSSESDSDSDSDSDHDSSPAQPADHDALALAVEHDASQLQLPDAEPETGQVTNRLAIVNLDWDHVNSTDLMALFSSFVPTGSGRILKISVYPSDFGKERMQQEELEGPPRALFKDEHGDYSDASDTDTDSGDDDIKKELITEGDDQDFDSDALRSYQMDRLRYYYAVMDCSSPETAKAIYEATDGTEYQSSSNVIDLRFVPDDVSFDDEPRDECSKVPESYKPVDFVTNALQSSKVKLTWDMHPQEASRSASIKQAFSGSRDELQENDLRAYLASDSDEDDSDHGLDGDEPAEPKLTKKELARKKMREALGLADDAAPSRAKDGPVGDMQITFSSALRGSKAKQPEQGESTIEKYKRKERERKERKRQDAKARRNAASQGDGDEADNKADNKAAQDDGEDAGFDDPFFTDQPAAAPSKSSMRKEERRKKREARQAAEADEAEQVARLSKAMGEGASDDEAKRVEHFDMKAIARAEKRASKARKKKNKHEHDAGDDGPLQQGFEMDVDDDRFNAVFDSHEFAIDPSNPKFKATGGMKKLLEEGRKKRKAVDGGGGAAGKRSRKGAR